MLFSASAKRQFLPFDDAKNYAVKDQIIVQKDILRPEPQAPSIAEKCFYSSVFMEDKVSAKQSNEAPFCR